jgi:hypothetical protein
VVIDDKSPAVQGFVFVDCLPTHSVTHSLDETMRAILFNRVQKQLVNETFLAAVHDCVDVSTTPVKVGGGSSK